MSRNILIVGGTAGIGKAAALLLAKQGHSVTVLGRDSERGQAAAREIRRVSGSTKAAFLACDLGSRTDVRRAAAEFSTMNAKLDSLILNAGVFLPKREVTADGLERTFASIYLGQFQLTELLLSKLKASSEGRIIAVTCPPGQARVRLDDLSLSKGYSTLKAQFQAKGALLMYVQELAQSLTGSNVTVNSMLPGMLIKTDLHANSPWLLRGIVQLFGLTPEQAADSESWLAAAPELKGISGRHFQRRKEKPLKGQTTDGALRKQVMELSRKLAGL